MSVFKSTVILLVGLTLFITGMGMMSSGMKKSTGKGLKRLFNKIQNNRFVSLGIGATATGIIQSSAATSVLVIGFVNAGIMTLFQGTAVIMGANIGTTVTGLIVSLSSFEVSTYLMLVGFIGLVLTFIQKERVKNIGEILTGFGILFFGLSTMSSAFQNGEMVTTFQNIFTTISFPLLVFLVGVVFTILIQSSSASIGIVIVLVGSGAINFETGMYLSIGASLGTWTTTYIATIGSSVNSKRTAIASLLIKLTQSIIALVLVWAFGHSFEALFINIFKSNEFALAMFNLFYNAIFMLAFLPLLEIIVKLSEKIVKDKELEENMKALKYIDNRILNTPSIALQQVKEEIKNMLELSSNNFKKGYNELMTQDFVNKDEIVKTEDKIDFINHAITDFLINLSHKVSLKDEKLIGSYFHIINDIERIGDHALNFHEMTEEMVRNDLKFSDIAKNELDEMYQIIDNMFKESLLSFENYEREDLIELHNLEEKTDKLKNVLAQKHFERITTNTCHVELSPFYSSLISELERVADHLVNIGYAFFDPTGDEVEIK